MSAFCCIRGGEKATMSVATLPSSPKHSDVTAQDTFTSMFTYKFVSLQTMVCKLTNL